MENITFSVRGMKCANCKKNIENAVLKVAGVRSAVADLDAKTVTVAFDAPADESAVKAAVEGAGRFLVE